VVQKLIWLPALDIVIIVIIIIIILFCFVLFVSFSPLCFPLLCSLFFFFFCSSLNVYVVEMGATVMFVCTDSP